MKEDRDYYYIPSFNTGNCYFWFASVPGIIIKPRMNIYNSEGKLLEKRVGEPSLSYPKALPPSKTGYIIELYYENDNFDCDYRLRCEHMNLIIHLFMMVVQQLY